MYLHVKIPEHEHFVVMNHEFGSDALSEVIIALELVKVAEAAELLFVWVTEDHFW